MVMVGGKEGNVNVFDFNSKTWEENHLGMPVLSNSQYLYSRLSSTITFDKNAKQKLMVLRGKLLKTSFKETKFSVCFCLFLTDQK